MNPNYLHKPNYCVDSLNYAFTGQWGSQNRGPFQLYFPNFQLNIIERKTIDYLFEVDNELLLFTDQGVLITFHTIFHILFLRLFGGFWLNYTSFI